MSPKNLFNQNEPDKCKNCEKPVTIGIKFCSGYCEFIDTVNNLRREIETLMTSNPFTCAICNKTFRLALRKKTYYPYCSRKCMNEGHLKDTKNKVLKYLGWLGEIHNGKITNKQVKDDLKEKILKFFPSVQKAVEESGNEYVIIKGGFKSVGRLSKAYKRQDLDGLFVRSSWEANYLRILRHLKWNYEYEPQVFEFPVKKGNRFYLPDVYLTDHKEYIEIKGFMDNNSRIKIDRFHKYYPDLKLSILGRKEYDLMKDIGFLLPIWEFSSVDDIVKNIVFKQQILDNKEYERCKTWI
jgi:endogenous inhibitor of DNA gyrase (YacG/DUF329 family)